MSDDYKVGYGKPPLHTRFQKGRSGNPRGRPRATRNLKSDLLEELTERITVREGDCERRVSKQRAMVKRLLEKALKGDIRATKALIDLILRILGVDDAAGQDDDRPLERDEQEMLAFLRRRERRKIRLRNKARARKRARGERGR